MTSKVTSFDANVTFFGTVLPDPHTLHAPPEPVYPVWLRSIFRYRLRIVGLNIPTAIRPDVANAGAS